MLYKNISAVLLGVIIILSVLIQTGCKETQVDPKQAAAALIETEKELDWLEYRLDQERWKMMTGQPSDSLEFFQELYRAYFQDSEKLNLLKGKRASIGGDEQVERKYDLIYPQLLKQYVESSPTLTALRDSLMTVRGMQPVSTTGAALNESQIDRVLAFDSDRMRRETAFRQRYSADEQQAELIGRMIRLRNQEATRLGFNDFFAMTYPGDGPTLVEYRKLLDDLEEATAAPYQAMLDRISSGAKEPWDLVASLSEPLRAISLRPTPDSQWTVALSSFGELGFNLNQMPIYGSLSEDANEAAEISALVLMVPHDLRLIGNLGAGSKTAMSLAGSLGHLIHANSITETEPAFKRMVDGTLANGVERMFEDMTQDSLWLSRYLNLPPSVVNGIVQARKDLGMVALRMNLLKLNFEYEAYRSHPADLNRLYWDLCDRIMRVTPHEDLYPWASDMTLVLSPVTAQEELYGKLIAAQTRAYLNEHHGNVVANRETRAFLIQNYMRFGARYPWSELLERGTGESLNKDHLLKELQ